MPYVGATPAAARVAFDKPIAKQVVAATGIRTPRAVALPADTFREVGAAAVMEALIERSGCRCSSSRPRGAPRSGCSLVKTADDLPNAMVGCFSYGPVALVERCIVGVEVTVPVLATRPGGATRTLPAVEIRPDGGVYDYTARYTAGATEFVVPASLDPAVAAECARVAELAHHSLGLRDLSRCDLMVDDAGGVWFLEVNVAPGMTETSLVPLSVEAAGLELGAVFAELVDAAVARRVDTR